jgi:hypothetical protein
MKTLLILLLIILAIVAWRKNFHIHIYRAGNFHPRRKKEGEVTLDTSKARQKHRNNNQGEYVDFTEIKETDKTS